MRFHPLISIIAIICCISLLLEIFFSKKVIQNVDPIQWDTKAPDMIENHLHVERFGPVHKTTTHPDGTTTQEEYWEAFITDDRNRHVYSVRCTPEAEAKWREFAKWAKGKWIMEIKDAP